MTMAKAIQILEDIVRLVKPGDPPEEHDAMKLGIEALIRVRQQQTSKITSLKSKLPSETED